MAEFQFLKVVRPKPYQPQRFLRPCIVKDNNAVCIICMCTVIHIHNVLTVFWVTRLTDIGDIGDSGMYQMQTTQYIVLHFYEIANFVEIS